MSTNPELSLIVSCYNQRPWMRLVFDSIAEQQLDAPFEVIVCDDGSSDGTLDEVQQRAATARDLDLRFLWQPDRGFRLSRSRNNGVRCARGGILLFVDGDSWLRPTCLRDHWDAHREGAALVCGMRTTLDVSADLLATIEGSDLARIPVCLQPENREQHRWLATSTPWMACLGGNFSVRRQPGVYFDEQFESWGSEDRDLAYRLFRGGLAPHLLDAPNIVHLRSPDETIANMTHDEVIAFIRNKSRLQAKYPDGALAPSVALIRRCRFDPATQTWSMGPVRQDVSVEDVFAEFRKWSVGAVS